MHLIADSNRAFYGVDNTDWLKAGAIILVVVDHIGYFFVEDDRWWSVLGRLAAPAFFFLIGYGQTRNVPVRWIWLGIILTLLESWNAGWTLVVPNILLSLALIRVVRPQLQPLLVEYGWLAFVVIVSVLCAALPVMRHIVDYGTEGWLWALFGIYQRLYVDGRSSAKLNGVLQSLQPDSEKKNIGLLRLLTCLIAAVVYIWREQLEFLFSKLYFSIFVLGVGILSLSLCFFFRGSSGIQPPELIATILRFIGRHTLEIYAIQLAAFEVVTKLFPDLGY